MKKTYYLLALSAFMFAGCSNDESFFSGGPEGNGTGKTVTFVFPGTAQGVVPYAGLATDSENELKTLDIYVFGEDSLASVDPAQRPVVLKEVFRSGDAGSSFTLHPVGSSYEATISVYPGAKRKFYFVANGRGNLSLDSLQLGITDTTAFLAKATNTLKGHIACPLLMSGVYPESGVIEIPDGGLAGKQNVTLTRRMARFDVLNWCEESSFKINKIVLKDVPGSNSIFAWSTPYTPVTVVSLPIIDFTSYENSNYGESKSVFYMYPTADTRDIKLSLVGETLAGSAQVYNVEFKKQQDDADFIPVLANNRYLLSILNIGNGTLDARIEVADWVVGDTVNNEVTHGMIKLNVATAELKAGRAFADNTLTLEAAATGNAAGDSIKVDVAADEEWELLTDCDWISFTALPGDSVLKSFKIITTTPNPSSQEARVGTIMVQNVKRPSIKQPLIVKQTANTVCYIDLAGELLAGNLISFSGEKMSSDSMNISVTVPAGADWTASEDADWFNLAKKAVQTRADLNFTNNDNGQTGNGPGVFSIVAQKNDTQTSRTDTITITISGVEGSDNMVQKIVVKQAPQNLGSIRLSARGMVVDKNVATNYNIAGVDAAGFADQAIAGDGTTANQERKISVIATSEWEVEVVDGSWLTITKDKQLIAGENGYFRIKAAYNATGLDRTDTIKVINTVKPELFKTIAVTQKAAAGPSVSVDQASLSFTAAESTGDARTITVTCPNAWTAVLGGTNMADFTLSAASGTGNGSFTVSPNTQNAGLTAKEATVTVKDGVTGDSKEITISQAATARTLSVDASSVTVSLDGSTVTPETINVNTNDSGNWEVSIVDDATGSEPEWVTATANTGVGTIAITMKGTIDNTGQAAARTATVTVSNTTDSSVNETITITQPNI